ncbi:N-terminal Xaa-Pro-Lys N-methyltransferase 1-like [Homarus americanus]|uniref:Alpha N-terminal protein methyltransferase 1 n=1 Tax=Homarus americanus TaxID=6706 RepID=A0A8J5JQY4_HOMAM|nr:N-terminal Xaa-Pro-Lys N-methyltransferase 1-like [Homarus americanus]KAG7162540.1 N-terminal Xaa-Pro-Lys N-methyltransferase 1-like [Homarus americanus]
METGEDSSCVLNPETLSGKDGRTDEDSTEETSSKAVAAQDPEFYSHAAAYWENIPATVNGMLGGFAHINAPDISASDLFIRSIFKMKNPPGHGRAVDCGAGIGRITKHLLQKHFGKVDLVEQCQNFIDRAKDNFKGSKKIGKFLCLGLQNFSPEPNTYDVIWCQWVLGHLTDEDLEDFFRRMGYGLKRNGIIVVKENVTSSGTVELDEVDSSVTRPENLLLDIIERAELRVLKNIRQPNLPKGLYEVKIMCLKPKKA